MEHHWLEHKHALSHFVRGKVSDPQAAEDILQDIYLKAHTALPNLRSEQRLGSWLYRIAHNTITDYFRQQQSLASHHNEAVDQLSNPEPDQAEIAHQKLAQCLAPLIKTLPERYQHPLQLAELEGQSQQQVAQQLGLSLSGAKSRIQRGRAQLRQRLIACCDIETGHGGVTHFEPKQPGCHRC